MTRSAGLRDVAMTVVSSEYRDNWMWCEGVGLSLIYRLKGQGRSNHPAPPHAHAMKR
jgi:hypothetical protein